MTCTDSAWPVAPPLDQFVFGAALRAAGIAGDRAGHALDVLKHSLHAPEAAARDDRNRPCTRLKPVRPSGWSDDARLVVRRGTTQTRRDHSNGERDGNKSQYLRLHVAPGFEIMSSPCLLKKVRSHATRIRENTGAPQTLPESRPPSPV